MNVAQKTVEICCASENRIFLIRSSLSRHTQK